MHSMLAAFLQRTACESSGLQGKTVRARVLVCADGTTSRIATRLGLCTAPPVGVCSRSYIEGGSHNFSGDGVIFYPRWSLPGVWKGRACLCAWMDGGGGGPCLCACLRARGVVGWAGLRYRAGCCVDDPHGQRQRLVGGI